ncbi:unnamed protein product [Clonostachys solani]|uniref:Uncharacterized protein n=1 Tax=Clonostachys solani TaxID=160281 RepID=A0A9P0EEA4_9HYPO|nr:unnamed protein product [Clonostachys solani]
MKMIPQLIEVWRAGIDGANHTYHGEYWCEPRTYFWIVGEPFKIPLWKNTGMENMKAIVIRLKKQVPVDVNWRRRQCGWGEGTALKPVLVDVECFLAMVGLENYIGRKTFQIYGERRTLQDA